MPPKGSDLGLKDDQENSFGDTYAESRLTVHLRTLANSSPLACCCEADTGEHEKMKETVLTKQKTTFLGARTNQLLRCGSCYSMCNSNQRLCAKVKMQSV